MRSHHQANTEANLFMHDLQRLFHLVGTLVEGHGTYQQPAFRSL